MWGEAAETGSRRGDAGSDMELGSRSRAARQKPQGHVVEADGSGHLYRWTGDPLP